MHFKFQSETLPSQPKLSKSRKKPESPINTVVSSSTVVKAKRLFVFDSHQKWKLPHCT
jgi:hypothetical protein